MPFSLDQFPTEIFYIIFEYLWAHEILFSFHNISVHLNNILSNYNGYLINFESIRKSHFDLIGRCIRPEQVIYHVFPLNNLLIYVHWNSSKSTMMVNLSSPICRKLNILYHLKSMLKSIFHWLKFYDPSNDLLSIFHPMYREEM
jgi:hypothetical protein